MTLSSVRAFRFGSAFILAGALSACAGFEPQSTVSRDLVSGVTSNNGGGMMQANYSSFQTSARTSPTFDTGNMAFPAPLPQGDLGTTRVR